VTAPLQRVGAAVYDFDSWSDGGAQARTLVVSSDRSLYADLSSRWMYANDAAVTEPGSGATSTVSVPVRLNAPTSRAVSVEWTTVAGTAGTSDFVPTSGVLVFPAGTTQQNVVVGVRGDGVSDGGESFQVRLSAPQNATIWDANAVVTISDPGPLPTVAVGWGDGAEGDTGTTTVQVPVTLSRPATGTVTVNYTTANFNATAGSDYVTHTGSVSFAPGETSTTVAVPLIGDRACSSSSTTTPS
jgi:hypothetical protein